MFQERPRALVQERAGLKTVEVNTEKGRDAPQKELRNLGSGAQEGLAEDFLKFLF